MHQCRSEARGVPNILTALPQEKNLADLDEGELYEDYEAGYYEDGAYTALPASRLSLESLHYDEEEDEDIDPQEAYYASLTERFLEIRAVLRSVPLAPPTHVPRMDPSSAASQATFLHTATHAEWRYQVMHNIPSMRVLASLHQDGVLRGLSRLEALLQQKSLLTGIQSKTTGAWCWGLLGRCRDIGEMGSEEVGILRVLGKTALRVGKKMRMQKRTGLQMQETAEMDDEVQYPYEDVPDDELKGGQVEAAQVNEEIEEGEVEEDGHQCHARMESDDIRNSSVDLFQEKNNEYVLEASVTKSNLMAPSQATNDLSASINSSEHENGPLGVPEAAEDPLISAKKLILARLHSAPAQLQSDCVARKEAVDHSDAEQTAFAVLDMIVTVVGEFYGQKDLLDARDGWGKSRR